MQTQTNPLLKEQDTLGTIPFLNLKRLYLDHKEEFDAAIEKQLLNTAYIGGNEVDAFCKEFGNWIGPGSHVVGSANGTDALLLAALSLGIPKGAEAILPAMSFIATLEAVVHAGFKVRLVDVEPGTWHMSPAALKKAISPQTKLIVPVHLYGQMAPMDEIAEIADSNDCHILEDSAQAHGAKWKNQPVGFWGDIAGYSFYPGKNLGAFGDGGAVLTRDAVLANDFAALSNHGGLEKYVHHSLGFNSRLDAIQAAILRVKLKYVQEWNEARRRVAKAYYQGLKGIAGLEVHDEHPSAYHVYHLYVVLVEKRDEFMTYLKKNGVESGIHYPKALHQHSASNQFAFSDEKFPVAEKLAAHGVSLPMCPTLSQAQIEKVITTVRGYFGKR